MKLVVFGLTITSSWGNGHANLWNLPEAQIELYADWSEAAHKGTVALADADVGMVTSYCPDGIAACELVLASAAALRVFYDLDTPVTLDAMASGEPPAYIPPKGLGRFDLVLSYTGGAALEELRTRLHARRVAPLYGSVDPLAHYRVAERDGSRFDLSYLGTYAKDRQATLEELFISPARQLPERRFVIGGAGYPQTFPWVPNVFFQRHLEPGQHSRFYCSSKLTLNVTRSAMAKMGYCPSGRLFEAAACGVPILSDEWEGLDQFFCPGSEILTAKSAQDTIAALTLPEEKLRRIARAARERVLDTATAYHRALDFEKALASAYDSGQARKTPEKRQALEV
jgi:spore maturation protein CgeB